MKLEASLLLVVWYLGASYQRFLEANQMLRLLLDQFPFLLAQWRLEVSELLEGVEVVLFREVDPLLVAFLLVVLLVLQVEVAVEEVDLELPGCFEPWRE